MLTGKEKICAALEAYSAAFALAMTVQLPTTSIITLVLFFLVFQVFLYAAGREKEALLEKNGKELLMSLPAKRRRKVSFLLGVLYTFLYLAAEHDSLTASLENRLFRLLYLLLGAAGLFFLFFHSCSLLLLYLERRAARIRTIHTRTGCAAEEKLPTQVQVLLFVILLTCWLPWFLYNFPGVMTPDSLSQYSQAMGLTAPSNHHPYLHTLIFRLFLQLGTLLFHDTYAAIACYTVFQMLAMAGIILYCIRVLFRCGAGKKLCLLFLLFYACIPYNGIFAVTIWKDVLFSGLVLLFVLSAYQLLRLYHSGERLWKSPPAAVLFVFSGVLVCLMRSNGLYAFLLTLPFLLWAFRKQWKIMLPGLLVMLGIALLVKGPLYQSLGVEEPAFSESLSIPAQQIARVVYEGRELTEEQVNLLDATVDYASIASYYQPELSDPIKALIQYGNPDYLEIHKGDYLRLWLQLGLKYPADYWNAFVDQTRGYWFPEAPGLLTNEGISPNELGLSAQPILQGGIVWKAVEIITKLYTIFPLYGLLYSIGAFTWAALFLFACCLLHGKKENLLLFVPFFAILFTLCAATPVASDVRYAYPLIFSMPFLIHISLEVPEQKDLKEKKNK